MEDEIKNKAAEDLVTHVHNAKYEGIVLSGQTITVAKALLERYWQKLYPAETIPTIYSFNSEGNSLLYKKELDAQKRLAALEEYIRKQVPGLELQKDKRLCYVDETINSGYKYESLKERFRELGYAHLDFAFFAALEGQEYAHEIYIAAHSNELVGNFVKESLAIHGYEGDMREVMARQRK